MATDFRTLDWQGSTAATAQTGAVALGGFSLGGVYQVKAAAIDNTPSPPVIYALILDDQHNARAVPLPLSGAGPFTFQ